MSMSIIMDGVTYQVRVRLGTLEQSFRVEDGDNAGSYVWPGDPGRGGHLL